TTTGTPITAAYNAGTGVLSLTGVTTVANYQQVLRTVTYNNTAAAPTTTARSVTFVVNDGTTNSATATSQVTMVRLPVAPTVDLNGPAAGNDFAATFNQGGGAVVIVSPQLTVTSASGNLASATITLTNRPDGAAEVLA